MTLGIFKELVVVLVVEMRKRWRLGFWWRRDGGEKKGKMK